MACALYAEGGAQVWVVDAASGASRRLEAVALNTVLDATLEWALDDRAILCLTVPAGTAAAPRTGRAAAGPLTREASGKAAPQRTSRDVLRTEDEQARFAWLATSQLARVPVAGGAAQPVGAPLAVLGWSVAPDEQHLLLDHLGLPAPLARRC